MTRPARPAREVAGETDLLAVAEPVRRVVSARLHSPADVDDVVQETLARLWEVRWRLERPALLSYGVVVARNLVTSAERGEEVRRRHAHRLADPGTPPDPALHALAAEERRAVLSGLAALRAEDRRLLMRHEVEGTETGKLAAEEGIRPGAVAARLARARARLRVEHLLALRAVELPTRRCRPVLEALSLGDRRRQQSVGAAEHLLDCTTCAELAEPLLTRRRSLTALAPVALLLALPGRLAGWVRGHPAQSTAATAAAAVAVALLLGRPGSPPAPAVAGAPPPAATTQPAGPAPATLSVEGVRLLPGGPVGSLREYAGRRAVAERAPIQSVPADEGFWIGSGPGRRVWVQLAGRRESPVQVRPGRVVSFTAQVVRAPADFASRAGISAAEGGAELRRAGAYLLVDPTRMSLG
jgi:RNA polymerase sigma factor (sigma-70 family)